MTLSRGAGGAGFVAWDGEHVGKWVEVLEGAHTVINLAGRSVDCRYNERNKREIRQSRIDATRALGQAISQLERPPRVWLNMSTATIYRHAMDREMDEFTGELGGGEAAAPKAWRFSVEVAREWEETFFRAATPATRKVALRSAMVMSPDRGGVFDTLLRLVSFGLGGKMGSGQQFVSWVHERDFARAVDFLIEREGISGVVNIASPKPLRNSEFMEILRRAWGTKFGLPAARWMLEVGAMVLGTETELILKSRRVVSGCLLAEGFRFDFPDWDLAASELVRRRIGAGSVA